jgi:glyoxylase-like metal-dependent hydrolase (beta-lactamase superfamily II)
MKLYTINTEMFKLDGGAMYGVVPKSMWNKLNPSDENNLCSWAMRLLLIQKDDKLILIDTGIGDKQDAKFMGHYYLHGEDTLEKSLNAIGFSKDDITDVIHTHLHFDHCGGSVDRVDVQLVPAFKNATYWSNEQHWNWAVFPNDREKASFLKENILPIKESGRLKFVEGVKDGVNSKGEVQHVPSTIIPELSFYIVNGHTNAMMMPAIQYKGKTIVYVADLLPSVGHLPIPYVMAYDMFPLITLLEKKTFLKEAADNDFILFFEHDPKNECCSLHYTERGIRQKEVFKLSEI